MEKQVVKIYEVIVFFYKPEEEPVDFEDEYNFESYKEARKFFEKHDKQFGKTYCKMYRNVEGKLTDITVFTRARANVEELVG